MMSYNFDLFINVMPHPQLLHLLLNSNILTHPPIIILVTNSLPFLLNVASIYSVCLNVSVKVYPLITLFNITSNHLYYSHFCLFCQPVLVV